MKKISEIIKDKKFTFSVEIVPPRNGADVNLVLDKIAEVKDLIDFVSVTKGAGGSLRGGTTPICYFVQEKLNIPAVAHFVAREHTKFEVENELWDLHTFGIRNVLCLKGDGPAGVKEEWTGEYKYSFKIVEHAFKMNNGIYLPTQASSDKERTGIKTDFCIGVAGHPDFPIKDELWNMKLKAEEGAEFIITQMVFSFEEYKAYVDALRKDGINIPVIAGIRPLKSIEAAESVENFFKIKVPASLKDNLDNWEDYFKDLITKLKGYDCKGVHFFTLNNFEDMKKLIG